MLLAARLAVSNRWVWRSWAVWCSWVGSGTVSYLFCVAPGQVSIWTHSDIDLYYSGIIAYVTKMFRVVETLVLSDREGRAGSAAVAVTRLLGVPYAFANSRMLGHTVTFVHKALCCHDPVDLSHRASATRKPQ